MGKAIDLTGRVFHRLTVLARAGRNNHGRITWLCKCECGKQAIAAGDLLRRGGVKSCGCLMALHGKSRTPLYHIWTGMRTRCTNPVKNYGARGISVCKEWADWGTFEKWALIHGYAKGLTLDRRDNNEGYSPENCRWVTSAIQNRNKRTNHLLSFQGKIECLTDVAAATGIHPATLAGRLKRGLSLSQALYHVKPYVKHKKRTFAPWPPVLRLTLINLIKP